jgi:hypothetical protein
MGEGKHWLAIWHGKGVRRRYRDVGVDLSHREELQKDLDIDRRVTKPLP